VANATTPQRNSATPTLFPSGGLLTVAGIRAAVETSIVENQGWRNVAADSALRNELHSNAWVRRDDLVRIPELLIPGVFRRVK
jgi:hypothetical protein